MAAVRYASSALVTALLALVVALLYQRSSVLYLFYANAPGRLQPLNNLSNVRVRFADTLRNCEDIFVNSNGGFALLSCDPGRDQWNTVMVSRAKTLLRDAASELTACQGTFENATAPPETGIYIYHYGAGLAQKPIQLKPLFFRLDAANFHPLGIEYDEQLEYLYVANHAESGPQLEIFKLFPQESTAAHVRSIRHPLLHAPNAITILSATELLVSNDHEHLRRHNPYKSLAETYLGLPYGSLVHVRLPPTPKQLSTDPINATLLAHLAFPNGLALLDNTTLAVASTSAAAVALYTSPSGFHGLADLTRLSTLPVPFLPDNLSLDRDGTLLIAGHPFAPTLEYVAQNIARCRRPDPAVPKDGCDRRAPSAVAQWRAGEGLQMLYVGDGFQSSSTAARDARRGLGFVTGLYERGILTWKE
ncbi:putative paraoxonase [Teratosphaeria destructans]|uniref:Paraoxonase n=1 Tax=Teratosphaeria destructans TaxID=418781 RepID=A0A9W7SPI7_9PEZI|nr:putative paraoxonase [Teratosphaeria destructans]